MRDRVTELLDLPQLEQHLLSLLQYTKEYALSGLDIARDLLRDYADMTLAREHILIPKGSILHLRPASALVEPVMQSKSPVLMEIDGRRVRANSVLEILVAMGEVADKINEHDIEMVLQGDREVVKRMKGNFLQKVLETR